MSFGYSGGDVILLTQLAWNVVQGARKACGEHDELARELSGLHTVLERLRLEIADFKSPLHRCDAERREELEVQIGDCQRLLKVVDAVLTKYNALESNERSGKKLWQRIKFGNGETKDLADIRLKICTHTQAITMALNLISLSSQGRVETQLSRQGRDISGIRESVNWVVAKMAAVPEASVMTNYTNDSKGFWREMRRELVSEGYPSFVIRRHKSLIKAYVKELGDRGVLDENSGTSSEPLTQSQHDGESLSSSLAGPHTQNQGMIEIEDLYSVSNQSDSGKRPDQEVVIGAGPTTRTGELVEEETVPALDEETTMDPDGRDQTKGTNRQPVWGTDTYQALSRTRDSLTSAGPSNGDGNNLTSSNISESGNQNLPGQHVKGLPFLKHMESFMSRLDQFSTSSTKLESSGSEDDLRAGYNELSETRLVTQHQMSTSSESTTSSNELKERASKEDDKTDNAFDGLMQLSKSFHPDSSETEEKICIKFRVNASSQASTQTMNFVMPGFENVTIQLVDDFDYSSVPDKSVKTFDDDAELKLELIGEYIERGQVTEFTIFPYFRHETFSFFLKLKSPKDIIETVERRFATDDIVGPWLQPGSHNATDRQEKSPMASTEWQSMFGSGFWIGAVAQGKFSLLFFYCEHFGGKLFDCEPIVDSSPEAASTEESPISPPKHKQIIVNFWPIGSFSVGIFYQSHISWEILTETLKFACYNFKGYRALFERGHFRLLGTNMKVIRPELWNSLLQPEWNIFLVIGPQPLILRAVLEAMDSSIKELFNETSEDDYTARRLPRTHPDRPHSRSGRRRRKRPIPTTSIWEQWFGLYQHYPVDQSQWSAYEQAHREKERARPHINDKRGKI